MEDFRCYLQCHLEFVVEMYVPLCVFASVPGFSPHRSWGFSILLAKIRDSLDLTKYLHERHCKDRYLM